MLLYLHPHSQKLHWSLEHVSSKHKLILLPGFVHSCGADWTQIPHIHRHRHTFPNTFIPGKWRQRHWWECGVWSICATWWTEENGQGGRRRRRKKRMNTNSHLSLICRPSTERQTHSRLSGSAQTAWSRFRRRMEGIHTACRQRFTKSNIPSVIQCLIHIFSLFVIHSLSY